MALTRIDCRFFRSLSASLDTSSYVAFNAGRTPGSLVLAGAQAGRQSIGGQVACKLALEHFVEGVLARYERGIEAKDGGVTLEILESAFREANTNVYGFGHKLLAGGRMAATLVGLVIEARSASIGRVGAGEGYLYREGELFPFFDAPASLERALQTGNLVGAHPLVQVELSSVPLLESDVVVCFARALGPDRERLLAELLEVSKARGIGAWRAVCNELYGPDDEAPFAMMAKIGPNVIYLAESL